MKEGVREGGKSRFLRLKGGHGSWLTQRQKRKQRLDGWAGDCWESRKEGKRPFEAVTRIENVYLEQDDCEVRVFDTRSSAQNIISVHTGRIGNPP